MSTQTVIPCRPANAAVIFLSALAAASGALLAAAAEALMQTRLRWQRRRELRRMQQALAGLPDDTLRDIGMARSEIGSVASESLGLIEATRARLTGSRQAL